MTLIDDLEKIYVEYFKDLFVELGFLRYETIGGSRMAAIIKCQNGSLRIQLINDRGVFETQISPALGAEQFRNIELFYSLVTLKTTPKDASKSDRQKISRTRLGFGEQAAFLANRSGLLSSMLDSTHFESTMREIDSLGQEWDLIN